MWFPQSVPRVSLLSTPSGYLPECCCGLSRLELRGHVNAEALSEAEIDSLDGAQDGRVLTVVAHKEGRPEGVLHPRPEGVWQREFDALGNVEIEHVGRALGALIRHQDD